MKRPESPLLAAALDGTRAMGAYALLLKEVCVDIATHGVRLNDVARHIVKIGTMSLPVVLLTAVFTGAVLALQTAYGLQRFGAKNYVGNIVSLSIVRELGPVLTALMLSGRVGAGIAAEIAAMVVTEQVDAMRALGANPIRKLVSPRIVAGIIVVPLLAVVANIIGIYGGALVAVYQLDITAFQFYRSIVNMIWFKDLFDGLIKSAVFGIIVVSVACHKGLRARGGTEGVGLTTTSSVVTSSILILISDFFVTQFLIALARL
jgi:phospholipid/cholesterol/gamma-HCH transport system permease protein